MHSLTVEYPFLLAYIEVTINLRAGVNVLGFSGFGDYKMPDFRSTDSFHWPWIERNYNLRTRKNHPVDYNTLRN